MASIRDRMFAVAQFPDNVGRLKFEGKVIQRGRGQKPDKQQEIYGTDMRCFPILLLGEGTSGLFLWCQFDPGHIRVLHLALGVWLRCGVGHIAVKVSLSELKKDSGTNRVPSLCLMRCEAVILSSEPEYGGVQHCWRH
jgi:hypothetical protein